MWVEFATKKPLTTVQMCDDVIAYSTFMHILTLDTKHHGVTEFPLHVNTYLPRNKEATAT